MQLGNHSNSFDPSANTLGYGTYYLRYAVINSCDEAYSNVVSFDVDAVPEAQMQLSWLQVCEGNALDLPDVNVNWNNHNEGDRLAQWQMSPTENGTYAAIDPTMLLQMNHNGYWLRLLLRPLAAPMLWVLCRLRCCRPRMSISNPKPPVISINCLREK